MRIRSIRDTARIFKEMDPNTEITEATLRKMIAEGNIPVIKTGVKFLLNVDLLLDMFDNPGNKLLTLENGSANFVVNK